VNEKVMVGREKRRLATGMMRGRDPTKGTKRDEEGDGIELSETSSPLLDPLSLPSPGSLETGR